MNSNIIYSGLRLGKNEKLFKIYKFRTMVIDADEMLNEISLKLKRDSLGKFQEDPRITKIGTILRRYALDEVPQIINIIKGEMCLVGIRPRNRIEWDYYSLEHKNLALKFKPGLFTPAYSKIKIKDIEELEQIESKYLLSKRANPIKTDIKYFFLIIYGVLNGARGK